MQFQDLKHQEFSHLNRKLFQSMITLKICMTFMETKMKSIALIILTQAYSLTNNTLIILEVPQTNKCTNENEAANENITSLSSKNDPNQSSSSTFSCKDIVKIP